MTKGRLSLGSSVRKFRILRNEGGRAAEKLAANREDVEKLREIERSAARTIKAEKEPGR